MEMLYGQVLTYRIKQHQISAEIPPPTPATADGVLIGQYFSNGDTVLLVKDLLTKKMIRVWPGDIVDFPGIQVSKGVIMNNGLNGQ